MALKNTQNTYGSISKIFHWVSAFIIIALLVVGFFMSDFSELFRSTAFTIHKSSGILLMVIMILRAIWMLNNPKPKMPANTPRWEIIASNTVHYAFYILLIIMPLSGWIMSCAYGYPPKFFGLFSLPLPGVERNIELARYMSQIHSIVAWCLVGLLIIHVTAALKHHLIDKNNILIRMLLNRN